jgi:hypothetical protein
LFSLTILFLDVGFSLAISDGAKADDLSVGQAGTAHHLDRYFHFGALQGWAGSPGLAG